MAIDYLLRVVNVQTPAVRPGIFPLLESRGAGLDSFINDIYDQQTIWARVAAASCIALGVARYWFGKDLFAKPIIGVVIALAANQYSMWERLRVRDAVRARALELFRQSEKIPGNTLAYLSQDSRAIGALLGELKNKYTKNLAEQINTLLQWMIPRCRWQLEVLKLFAEPEYKLLDMKVLLDVFSKNAAFALYLLDNDLIKTDKFTPDEQATIWAVTEDVRVMHKLLHKGLRPDIQVLERKLARILQQAEDGPVVHGVPGLCGLLSIIGRDRPSQVQFTKTNGEVVTLTLDDIRKKYPNVAAALDQEYRGESVVPDSQVGLWSLAPPVDIALKQGKFGLAEEALTGRAYFVCVIISAVSAAIFGAIYGDSQLSFLPSFAVMGIGTVFSSISTQYFHQWDVTRAIKVLNAQASQAFNSTFPAHAVTRYLAEHPESWTMLDRRRLNKLDNQGRRIWDFVQLTSAHKSDKEFNVLAYLLDAVFAKESCTKADDFAKIVAAGDVESMQYILYKNQKIKITDFNDKQYLQLLDNVRDKKVGEQLFDSVFDVNREIIIDNQPPQTVLHYLLNQKNPDELQIQALLAAKPAFDKSKVKEFDKLTPPLQKLLNEYAVKTERDL
jgi:hypothetical protein